MTTAGVNVITPLDFANIIEQLSVRFMPEIEPKHLKADAKKYGERGGLDSHIEMQDQIKQFITRDLLANNSPKDLQRSFDFYVKTLKTCIEKNDFQSASTILGAIKSPPILRLRKEEFVIKNEAVEILEKKNACIKTNSNQKKILSEAEILFNPSNRYKNYRDKIKSLQDKQQHVVPMTSTMTLVYVDLTVKKEEITDQKEEVIKDQKKEEITDQKKEEITKEILSKYDDAIKKIDEDLKASDESLKYYQECAAKKKDNDIKDNFLYKLISKPTLITENEFNKLTDNRSRDILPRGKDAVPFNTQPSAEFQNTFDFTVKESRTKRKKIISALKRYSPIDKLSLSENRDALTQSLIKTVKKLEKSDQWEKTKIIKDKIHDSVDTGKKEIKGHTEKAIQKINDKLIKPIEKESISQFDPIINSILSEISALDVNVGYWGTREAFKFFADNINMLNEDTSYNDKKGMLDSISGMFPSSVTELRSYKDFYLLADEMIASQNKQNSDLSETNSVTKASTNAYSSKISSDHASSHNSLLFSYSAELKQVLNEKNKTKIAEQPEEENKTNRSNRKP